MAQFRLMYAMLTEEDQSKLAWVLITACLMAVFEALGIVAIFYFFSFITGAPVQSLDQVLAFVHISVTQNDVLTVGILVLIIIVGKNVYSLWCSWYQNHYVSYVRHSLSIRLLSSIISRQYTYFLKQNSDVLKARFLTDIDRITDGYLRGFIALISEAMVATAIIAILLVQDFTGTLMVIGVLGITGLMLHFILKKFAGQSSNEFTQAQHSRYLIGGMMMTGVKDIKAGCREAFFHKMFSNFSEKFSKVQIVQMMILASPRLVIETLAFTGIVISLILVAQAGEGVQTMLPTIAIYGAAAYRILPSLNRIISSMQQIKFAEEPIHSINQMISESNGSEYMKDIDSDRHLPFENSISVAELSYGYPESSSLALKNISFSIKKNDFIGIVGSSGAGKSSLIDILLALLHPSSGVMMVDEEVITEANSRHWRRNIGYVPQSIFLLDGTLAQNIAFGRDVDLNEIQRVAVLAQIDQLISTMPGGYETKVGENGVRLSGGQRQRIGIARALYGGAEILLLDEATSALDNETEREVTKSILSLAGKVTMIVVAHRLSTVKYADKLLLLDKGSLVAEGTFDELTASSSVFRRISLMAGNN